MSTEFSKKISQDCKSYNPIEELRLIEEEIKKSQDPIVLTERELKNIAVFLRGR